MLALWLKYGADVSGAWSLVSAAGHRRKTPPCMRALKIQDDDDDGGEFEPAANQGEEEEAGDEDDDDDDDDDVGCT
jgi:hypothetical protein